MAAVYKCTKITNLGVGILETDKFTLRADYYNPTIPNPPEQFVSVQVHKDDVSDPQVIKDAIDAQLGLLGADTMNWAI